MSDRNRQLYALRSGSGITFRELGKRFGISAERAQQIFKREKEKSENPPKSLMTRALRAHGLENPSLQELRIFLQRLEDDSKYGWEMAFMCRRGVGPKALKEMRDFAEKEAILPAGKARADPVKE